MKKNECEEHHLAASYLLLSGSEERPRFLLHLKLLPQGVVDESGGFKGVVDDQLFAVAPRAAAADGSELVLQDLLQDFRSDELGLDQ